MVLQSGGFLLPVSRVCKGSHGICISAGMLSMSCPGICVCNFGWWRRNEIQMQRNDEYNRNCCTAIALQCHIAICSDASTTQSTAAALMPLRLLSSWTVLVHDSVLQLSVQQNPDPFAFERQVRWVCHCRLALVPPEHLWLCP